MNQSKFDLPLSCYVFIHADPGQRIGLVTQGQNGFLITTIDQSDLTDRETKMLVNTLNSARGVNPETAERMLSLAIRGWKQPCNQIKLAA